MGGLTDSRASSGPRGTMRDCREGPKKRFDVPYLTLSTTIEKKHGTGGHYNMIMLREIPFNNEFG